MAAALVVGPAAGVRAASVKVAVKAKVVKPLVLKVKQDLDFGQIALPGTPGTRIVSISQSGVLTCGAGLTCSGAARQAIFNVSGSNGQVARISTAPSNLTNGSGGTIVFTPSAAASVTFTNSGNGGLDFGVGGSIPLTSTTSDGLYSGTVEVTVDYQ
ncbi:MAG: DUF4402 domain-containing protein [Sphingomicrobium sp.]